MKALRRGLGSATLALAIVVGTVGITAPAAQAAWRTGWILPYRFVTAEGQSVIHGATTGSAVVCPPGYAACSEGYTLIWVNDRIGPLALFYKPGLGDIFLLCAGSGSFAFWVGWDQILVDNNNSVWHVTEWAGPTVHRCPVAIRPI